MTPGIMDNVGIAFHFENKNVDMFSGQAIDLDNWRLIGKAYGITDYAMIDLSDARPGMTDESVNFTKYDSIAAFEAAAAAAGQRIAYMSDRASLTSAGFAAAAGTDYYRIDTYAHNPATFTWYIFGPAAGFLPSPSDGKDYIVLPQANENINLFSFQVAPIIMAWVWWGFEQAVGGPP